VIDDAGDSGTWMTKAELAAARGISIESVERLMRRHRWRRQPGNDSRVRVLVPSDWMTPRDTDPPHRPPPLPIGDPPAHPPPVRSDADAVETVLAALREAHEEVDLDPALVRVAGLATPYRTLTGYHITPVVGFVDPSARFKANAGEVADVFEVPFVFLMDPANHERRHRDQPPGPPRWHWAITWPETRGKDRLIWGATAGMVRGLYDRLEAARGKEP